MTILEGDIKLLKSAVMADTSDGGGQMTGTEVVDGQSNNLFPDTSEIDRALGRVNLRKVFGVAHTNTTDTLLGSHAIITDAPDDPLVACTLMASTNWADKRDSARSIIERYLLKGPRFTCRLLDMHYAGTMVVRLYAPVGSTDFPASGDAIVLRNVNGEEQYVRITKVATMTQSYTVFEGNATVPVTVLVATCDLGQSLIYDFVGAPVARAILGESATYASVYTTQSTAGARFYGIKTLGSAVATGDVSATVSGGIFTPLVPAATVETPLIDQSPYSGRSGVIPTALSSMSLQSDGVSVHTDGALAPNSVVRLPTAIKPGTLTLNQGFMVSTDSGGLLYTGTTVVGAVDYALGTITLNSAYSNPAFWSTQIIYTPATSSSSLAVFSQELMITLANRGLSFTAVFDPIPAPGSFRLSYMAQGRWYVLKDDGAGKLAGADSSYGVGNISYTTGSMSVTLGAIPDVGSVLIADWGDPSTATGVTANLPTKLHTLLALPVGVQASGISLSWANGATNYSATSDASGALSGNATGQLYGNVLKFEPGVFPSGDVTASISYSPTPSSSFTGSGLSYTLTSPVVPGSVSGSILINAGAAVLDNTAPTFYDGGNGVLYAVIRSGHNYDFGADRIAIGTINYSTGAVVLTGSITANLASPTTVSASNMWGPYTYIKYTQGLMSVSITAGTGFTYSHGTTGTTTVAVTPTGWTADVGISSGGNVILLSDILLYAGNELYSSNVGTLRKGWNVHNGAADVVNAGTVNSTGRITLTSLPANKQNTLTWKNLAMDAAGKSVSHGVFRTNSAPLKTGVFQMLYGVSSAAGNDGGVISGGGFTGTVDYTRGVVRWDRTDTNSGLITYNAVFLQYLPLDGSLLGLETARLPLDGKVPIFRSGTIVIVHNTQTYTMPNPLTKGIAYDMGRIRVAAVKVRTANGAVVDTSLYTTDLDAGTITFPVPSDLTGLTQPFTVDHRIEDVMLCSQADISGQLTFTRALTHNYPANTSYVSSALVFGDVFARVYSSFEQGSWSNIWSDTASGSAPNANFNETLNPIAVTNNGAITERWVMLFTNTTTFRIIGETVGEIGTGNTGTACAPINPATGSPYFTIPSAGWGSGWAAGAAYRFNTGACGTPFWVVRTVLQGPATLQSDKFTLAFRGDVDRP